MSEYVKFVRKKKESKYRFWTVDLQNYLAIIGTWRITSIIFSAPLRNCPNLCYSQVPPTLELLVISYCQRIIVKKTGMLGASLTSHVENYFTWIFFKRDVFWYLLHLLTFDFEITNCEGNVIFNITKRILFIYLIFFFCPLKILF